MAAMNSKQLEQVLAKVHAGNVLAESLIKRATVENPEVTADESLALLAMALQYTAQNIPNTKDRRELETLALTTSAIITAAYQYGREHTLNEIAGGQCEHCRRVAAGDLTIGRAVRADFLWSHKAADGFHTCHAADVWNAVDRDLKDTPIG